MGAGFFQIGNSVFTVPYQFLLISAFGRAKISEYILSVLVWFCETHLVVPEYERCSDIYQNNHKRPRTYENLYYLFNSQLYCAQMAEQIDNISVTWATPKSRPRLHYVIWVP